MPENDGRQVKDYRGFPTLHRKVASIKKKKQYLVNRLHATKILFLFSFSTNNCPDLSRNFVKLPATFIRLTSFDVIDSLITEQRSNQEINKDALMPYPVIFALQRVVFLRRLWVTRLEICKR